MGPHLHYHCFSLWLLWSFQCYWVLAFNNVETLPSTMIIARDSSSLLGSLHTTGEGLFSKEILWKVNLAGLVVDDSSGTLNPEKNATKLVVLTSPDLSYFMGLSGEATVTFQNRLLPELLLQVNETFPINGTTYPPGMDRASEDRLTVIKGNDIGHLTCTHCFLRLSLT